MNEKIPLLEKDRKQCRILNEIIYQLSCQQDICESLALFLSYMLNDLAGTIDITHFTALDGMISILRSISKNLESAYDRLDDMLKKP